MSGEDRSASEYTNARFLLERRRRRWREEEASGGSAAARATTASSPDHISASLADSSSSSCCSVGTKSISYASPQSEATMTGAGAASRAGASAAEAGGSTGEERGAEPQAFDTPGDKARLKATPTEAVGRTGIAPLSRLFTDTAKRGLATTSSPHDHYTDRRSSGRTAEEPTKR